jgi:ADP-ribose pyrophosphatase YjhB (NUDIX family)
MSEKKKAVQRAYKGKPLHQVAAIPFRVTKDGAIRVMLVTSRETRRFTLPKGWRMKGKSDRQAAAVEARQEAGVKGKMLKRSPGSYHYWKRLSKAFVHVEVVVYLLMVSEESKRWKEFEERSRAWLSLEDAALLVDEPELGTLLRSLDGRRDALLGPVDHGK